MKKILFVRSENAFLPEISAYIDYFNKTESFKAYDSSKLKIGYDINDFDIIWEFKGLGGIKANNKVLVHEYASLSTGTFSKIKDTLKATLNPKPDLRIFLNQEVKKGFRFKDGIDYCYRDMGIDKRFIQRTSNKKEYDFVYVGSICKERGIDKLLKSFTQRENGTLCLIGGVEEDIYNKYKDVKNIYFAGKLPYEEVYKLASKAVYGINYIPDKYPYNIQTSTKLLEYLALGLKVVTTDYRWIREFENKYKCSFYKFNDDDFIFDIEKIKSHEFKSNFNPEKHLWEDIIRNSEIESKLLNLCK